MSYLSSKEDLIRAILNNPCSVKEVAEEHDVSEGTVRNVKMLRTKIAQRVHTWMVKNDEAVYLIEPAKRFSKAQVASIRASKVPSPKLAQQLGVAESTIRMIRTGKSYAV